MKTLLIGIAGMHCEGCAETIKALLDVEPGVKASSVSYKDASARVLFDPDTVDEAGIVTAVERGGYKVTSGA